MDRTWLHVAYCTVGQAGLNIHTSLCKDVQAAIAVQSIFVLSSGCALPSHMHAKLCDSRLHVVLAAVQVDWVIRGQWHTDYRGDLPKWATWGVFALGHLGCLGRAGIFLAVAVLFFKEVSAPCVGP